MAWDADSPQDGDVIANFPDLHTADKTILQNAINAGRVYFADTENDKPKTPGSVDTSFKDGMFCYVKDTDMFYYADSAAWAGTATFTASSAAVAGVGTAFDTEIEAGDQITWNAATVWYEVQSVSDANNLTLTANVSGGASGSAFSVWKRCNLAPELLTTGTISSALTFSGSNTFSGTNTFGGATVQTGALTLPSYFISNPNIFAKTTNNLTVYNSSIKMVYVFFNALAVFHRSTHNIRILTYTNLSSLYVDLSSGTGVGHLDTGTIAANKMYHIWVIHNPSTGASGIIASLADKADSLTLPSGYTYTRLISCCRTDSTPNIIDFTQRGNYYHYYTPSSSKIVDAVAAAAYPNIANKVDLSTWIPGTTSSSFLPRYIVFTVSSSATNTIYVGYNETSSDTWTTFVNYSGQVTLPLVASDPDLYWGGAAGTVTIYINSFLFPLEDFEMITGYE